MAVVADELLLVVKSNITQAMAGLSAVETKAGGLGGAFKKGAGIATKAIGGIGIAAGAIGIASATMATGFEKGMAQIEALVGVPKDEMEELKDAALDMGKHYGVSADDAASGLFFLKSAGLDTTTAIEALNLSAQASAIGLGDMEDLANTATTAMTNFGDQGVNAARAFDDIATAARLAKADPSELGRIMNMNSASASLVGMTYEDMAGTLALLTRKFGDSRKAGTGMEGILRKLIKPSKMATDMLDEIGISAEDFQKILADDLPGGLHQLDKAFADNGISQSEWLGKVFEDGEAIKAAAAVIGTSGDEINEIYDGMADSQGALQEGWGVMEDTASVKFAKMKEGIKSALIPIGLTILDVVVPAISTLVDWITTGVEWFSDFITGASEVSSGFAPVFDTLSSLVDYFKTVFDTGDSLNDYLAEMPEWFQPVVQALGDLVAYFKDNWQDIYDNIVETWEEVWSYIEPVVTDIADFLQDNFADIVAFISDNMDAIKEVIDIVMGVVKRTWERFWNAIKDHIKPIWDAIRKIIEGVLDVIKGIIQTVLGVITGDWDRAWEGIKMIFGGVWDAMVGILQLAWEAIQTVFDVGLAAIGSAWDVFWSTLGNGITAVFDGIVGVLKGVLNTIISVLEGAINAAIYLINGAIDNFNQIPLAPDLPNVREVSIPRLASGGTVASAGSVLVGEYGPEMLNLPQGARVTPLNNDSGAGGGIVIENVNSYGADSLDVARDIGWELTKRGVATAWA